MKLLKQWWWKILGIVCLIYTFLGGLLIPLGPGILKVSPDSAPAGDTLQVSVSGYNTHFSKAPVSAWLRYRQGHIKALQVICANDNELSASFLLPAKLDEFNLENNAVDLVTYDEQNGTLALRNAILVKQAADSSHVISAQTNLAEAIPVKKGQGFFFPYREILYESIRNLFFHVPMWFSMLLLLLAGFICSIRYLYSGDSKFDVYTEAGVQVGLLFGFLGIFTGMTWANFTWGSPWPNDPKLNGAAIAMMIYLAYVILRGSIPDEIRRAKVTAVYNIFAFVIYITFIFIYPRLTDTLHPGNGGNPAFSSYDLDSSMRAFFYPAVIGWSILGFWLASLKIRYKFALLKLQDID